jgi:hypothetical protein
MFDRLFSVLVAVSLALLVWLYARSRDQEVLDNVPLPVQVVVAPHQAEHYHLELTGPTQVPVSFTGPPARIRELQNMLQRRDLQIVLTVTVGDEHLREARYSGSLQVEPSDIHAPMGITPIVPEGRNRVPFTLHRQIERRLPVRFDYLREGSPGPLVLSPPTVLVRGPQEVLDRVRDIPTEPSELPSGALRSPGSTAVGRVALVRELEGRPIHVTPRDIQVRVVPRDRKIYELTDVPVQFLCPPLFQLRPKFLDDRDGKVCLRLTGPIQDEPPKVHAYIDLSRGQFPSGLHHEPLQLQLPRDFQLAGDGPPRVVGFELLATEVARPNDSSP